MDIFREMVIARRDMNSRQWAHHRGTRTEQQCNPSIAAEGPMKEETESVCPSGVVHERLPMLQEMVPHSSLTENTEWTQGLKKECFKLRRKNGVGV